MGVGFTNICLVRPAPWGAYALPPTYFALGSLYVKPKRAPPISSLYPRFTSVKLSNNALNFLLAQYRAIFKRAYVKGLASAVVLTAALTAAQAQAVSDLYLYDPGASSTGPTSGGWSKHNSGQVYGGGSGGLNVYSIAAGAIAGDAIKFVTGYPTNIADQDAIKNSSIASGGKLIVADQATNADYNFTSIAGKVWGGDAQTTTGNAYAEQNKVLVTGSASITGAGDVIGGRAISDSGAAYVTNNEVTVTKVAGKTISIAGMLKAGYAEGYTGAVAEGGTQTVTGLDGEHQSIGNHVIGGHAYAKASGTGNYRAEGNTVDLQYVDVSGSAQINIVGGLADGSNAAAKGDHFSAVNNTISIKDSVLNSTSQSIYVIGNQAESKSTGTSLVQAIGTEGETSVLIEDSAITSGTIIGGQAVASGSATASYNSVVLSDTTVNNESDDNGIFGALVDSKLDTGKTAIVTATGNTLEITNSATDTAHALAVTTNNIVGARINVGNQSNLSGTSITGNDNVVTIGENVNLTNSRIYGVEASVGNGQGSTVNLSRNQVVLNGTFTGENIEGSSIVGAYTNESSKNVSLTDNAVTIAGDTTTATIMGAYVFNGTNDNVATVTGNSVLVEADTKVSKAQIFAARTSGTNAVVTNNDVTIRGSLYDVPLITGGAGADSVVSLEEGSLYNVSSAEAATKNQNIISDVVKVAGTIQIANDSTLQISGYYQNGKVLDSVDTDTKFNPNNTTIASSANLLNAGKLTLLGQTTVEEGATLHATGGNSKIVVEGLRTDTEIATGDVDVAFVNDGSASLSISSAQLKSYLNSGDKYTLPDDTHEQDDVQGLVQITKGGVLDFSDSGSVNLNDFEYSTDAVPNKIQVDGSFNATSGSIIKGDELVLAHKFATDNEHLDTDTFDAAGIALQAGSLTLGSSALYSEDSAEIKFDHADVSESVTFATNGKFNATNPNAEKEFTGFRLEQFDLNLDAKYEVLNVDGSHNRYEALSGTLNGADVRVKDSGSINVYNGNWTANNSITLASGATLNVGSGGASQLGDQEHAAALQTDATLTFNDALVLDLTAAGDVAINVQGADSSSFYDEEDPTDKLALLDLRQGLQVQGTDAALLGNADLNVTQGGVVLLNADSVNTILAHNKSDAGVNFSGDSHGSYVVDGDVRADFGDFSQGETGFNLSENGYLFANSLSVINTPATDEVVADGTFQSVDFGGKIVVDDLIISDHQRTNGTKPADAGRYASEVNISGGDVYIFNSLASDNYTVGLTNASATFVKTDASATGGITAGVLRLGDSGSANFVNGIWETDTDFILSGANSQLNIGDNSGWDERLESETSTTMTGSSLTVTGTDAQVNVYSDGAATFTTAALTTGAVNVYGDLTILGDANATTTDGKDDTTNGVSFGSAITIENNGHLTFGAAATTGAILEDNVTATATTVTLKNGFEQIQNNGGMLELGLSGSVFSADAIADLKSKLFTAESFNSDGILQNGGVINIGQATFVGLEDKITNNGDGTYTAAWDNIKGWSDVYGQNLEDITNNVLGNTIVTDIDLGDSIQGNYGALRMSSGYYNDPSTKVTIAGSVSLRNAAINGGKFISNADGSVAFGADIQQGKTLTLIGGGDIGDIAMQLGNIGGTGDVERDYTILRITSTAEDPVTNITSITGTGTNIGNGTVVEVQGNTAVSGDISNIDDVNVFAALSAANINVQSLDSTNGIIEVSDTITAQEADLAGGSITTVNYDFTGTSNADQDLAIYNGATLTVSDTLHVVNAGDIWVGGVLSEAEAQDEAGNALTGTGYLSVANLDLDQGTLWVDPAYGEQTSIGAVGYFKDNNSKSTMVNDAGIINGNVYVGQNAALGIGTTDIAEVADAIARYQTNGSLSKDQYGSILYLNGQVELRDGAELALNSAESIASRHDYREVLRYTVETNVVDQYADMGLGANTAILMTEAAFEDADGNKTQTAIKFDKTGATINAEGGEIVLVGSFDAAQKLNFFEDNDGDGHKGVYIYGQDVKVYTQNGFLFTTLEAGTEAGYGETLHVDKEQAYSVMSEASDPVVATLISYHEDRLPQDGGNTDNGTGTDNGTETVAWTEIQTQSSTEQQTAQAEPTANESTDLTPIEPPVNNAPTTKVTGSSSFLNEVVTASHGAPAEQAARLGVYGGSAQVGLAAANSNADVLASRFGIGANAQSLNLASNGMGGTLWVAPIYKSQDSDGFAAQGLNYGVDFDLYGVALGGDYKVTNEITVGAMFNVGSGDLDGQGNTAAAGVSNDFDYFGFGLYGAYQAGALTVTADLSYTQIDNDLEGNNEVGKVSASADTTAWSLGVTGQYQFTFASIDVTPHAGLRFTALDLDDYGVNAAGHGNVANFDSDTLSVFSIPVGVTFAKSFKSETWTVTPALDLQVTGQFGDDEAEGSVSWSGTNLSTNVTSEVFDNFTYGATVGVEAQSVSGFSFGLGLGYTGSSNVDEFSAQANARFTF